MNPASLQRLFRPRRRNLTQGLSGYRAEIIREGQDKPYSSLVEAKRDDYNPCAFCLQDSTR
jgi:hypothetical protein